ncbi:hypothetical protein GCM10023169_13150 [Georgenia halophila]|uniref:Uncharacterized protein n=1 Tax=Georgenia halophila TaxID=620889 RepID=A0ABP8KVS8_9MICO
MSTDRPEPTAIELDPDVVGEEHHVDGEPVPEEYEPEPELAVATREADAADVADQLDEVPDLDDESDADDESGSY